MADAENKLYRIVGTALVPIDAEPEASEQPDATAEPKKPAKQKTAPATDNEGVSDANNTN